VRPSRLRYATILLAAAVAVQAASTAAQQRAPGPRAAARPRASVDPLSASIQGRVTAADTGAPLRRAEVRAMSERSVNRLVTTDGNGQFELRDLPAGEYRLTVSKSGFVSLAYGQRQPFEAAEVIALEQGQRVSATMALPRAGAIAGRIIDEYGEPLAQTRVQALRARTVEGRRRLQPAGPVDLTDDTGAFRLYGLAPGDYYVSATPRQPPDPIADAVLKSTMTSYYPGTASLEDAQRITVGVGGESRADMQLGPIRGALVAGIIFSSDGQPAGDAQISLRSEIVSMGVSAVLAGPPPLSVSAHSAPDGTFAMPGVPPGPYVLQVSLSPDLVATGKPEEPFRMVKAGEHASVPVMVSGGDVTGLAVTTGTGGTIEGTFARDTGVAQPLPTGLEVTAVLTSGGPSMINHSPGTFRLTGLTTPMRLRVSELPDGWMVKAILVDGIDMTDQPIDVRNGRTASARIVLTDRVTEIAGTVVPSSPGDERRRRDHSVVVFPADAAKWTFPSRYLRTVRADEQGAFRIRGLPGDERYLAIAVNYLEEGEGSDAEFLERMRDRATTFSLNEGERASVDLRLIER
jgi:hypothetical protein